MMKTLDFLFETLVGLMKKSHNECIDSYKFPQMCFCGTVCGDVTEKDKRYDTPNTR